MTCSSKGIDGSVKYAGTTAAGGLSQLLDRDRKRRLGGVPEKGEQLTGRGLAEIVNLLECKLAWYGFRSVEIGPFVKVNQHTISVDLSQRGALLCRIEVDRKSGAVTRTGGRVLRP